MAEQNQEHQAEEGSFFCLMFLASQLICPSALREEMVALLCVVVVVIVVV